MPFVSKAQERWAFATGQKFAKTWADMTNQAGLPERKKRVLRKLRKHGSSK